MDHPPIPSPSRAIVTDGLWRKSLSAVRSLGKSGFDVSVLGDTWLTTSFWSRFTKHRRRGPVASRDPEGFGSTLLAELKRSGPGSVVLPMEDSSLFWAVKNQSLIEAAGGVILGPTPEQLEIAQDKSKTLELAERLGLPCPKTWRPESADEFAKLALSLEPGAFVVKPRSGTGSSGVNYGDRKSEAEWRQHWQRFGRMLVQERVPKHGPGVGVSLLLDRDGRCILSFAHRRLQQYPNSGGPSTDREGIHAPELTAQSIRLLSEIGWRGIAMVEWKIHPQDGRPRLMEINPRFWGSLELAVRSGLDFPALYARAALGEVLPDAPAYDAGTRCRWMIPGEVLRYLTQPKAERESILKFLAGLPRLAEEWDPQDVEGGLATIACTALLALHPRYWKYVNRG